MITEEEKALAQLADFVARTTHWKEGGTDRHTALKALEALQSKATAKPALLSVDEYQAKYANVITLTDDMRYGYECLYNEIASGLQATPAATEPTIEYTPGEWFDATTVELMKAFYRSRLPAIREAAKEHGYAIGVHGSMRRDMDLLAVPWRDGASDAGTLAEAIQKAACGFTQSKYQWEQKPAGRIAVSMPVCWTHRQGVVSDGHIDLSVAPAPNTQPKQAAPFVHKKTGGKYQFVGNARIQSDAPLKDMDYVVVYRGDDDKLWVRANGEFMDRFMQEGRPNRMMCDDVLDAEAEAGGVLAVSPELYESMRSVDGASENVPQAAAIPLSLYEMQSNHSRVNWAEDLIRQLPENHDGRNSWLLNYGNSPRPKDYVTATAPTPTKVDDMQRSFNAAIDFAIQQGSSASEFLESWREGDTSEWPEFTTKPGDAT